METIIIGLGNPGAKYKNTRHNVGFLAVDKISGKNNFPDFKLDKKSNALISEQNNILLVKPQTFMNESGSAVKKIIKNKEVKNIIVIHDDIDLEIGKIKIVKERGSAGHKGVESIIKNIGNDGLIRIRIGIGGQTHGWVRESKAEDVVLKKFSKNEQPAINEAIEKACQAAEAVIKNGLDQAMNEFN